MSGIIGVIVVLVLAIAFAWLSIRAWRMRNVALRIIGGLVSTLVTLVLAAVSVVSLVGVYRLYAPHGGPAPNITATVSADRLAAAGRRVNGCTGCHSTAGTVPLDGGATNFLGGNGPNLGVLVPQNLTPAGPLKGWTDGEILRAIREGIDRDGHPLLIMPSDAFHNLSDDDAIALVAYLRSQPAVNHPTPDRDMNLLGLVIIGAGLFPTAEQPHITQPQSAPPPGTPAYGQYLVNITGCRVCHGPDLTGGTPGGFGPPAGPSLRAIVPQWSDADFVKFFRTGVDAGGRNLGDSSAMPWKDIGLAHTDDELRAIYTYIRGLS